MYAHIYAYKYTYILMHTHTHTHAQTLLLRVRGPQEDIAYVLALTFPTVSRMSCLSNFDGFRDKWLVSVQLLLCGFLPPGPVQYSVQQSCAIVVNLSLVVHPYSSIDTTAAWKKKLRFILSDRSDFHMTDSIPIASQALASRVLISFSTIEMPPSPTCWSSNTPSIFSKSLESNPYNAKNPTDY